MTVLTSVITGNNENIICFVKMIIGFCKNI